MAKVLHDRSGLAGLLGIEAAERSFTKRAPVRLFAVQRALQMCIICRLVYCMLYVRVQPTLPRDLSSSRRT